MSVKTPEEARRITLERMQASIDAATKRTPSPTGFGFVEPEAPLGPMLSPPEGNIFQIEHKYNREDPRPSWPETWMTVARAMAARSYDPRLKVGAIVVSCDNTQMLSVGFNGNYKGGPHEHESTEAGQSGFVHAETNALVKCDFNFAKKKHMYVTHSPCRACAKLIINAEIARVVYENAYRDTSGVDLLRSTGIEVFSIEEAVKQASYSYPK